MMLSVVRPRRFVPWLIGPALLATAAPAIAQDNVVGPPAEYAPPPISAPQQSPPPAAERPVLPPPVVPTVDDDTPAVGPPPTRVTPPAPQRTTAPAAPAAARPEAPAASPEPDDADAPAPAAQADEAIGDATNTSAPAPGFSPEPPTAAVAPTAGPTAPPAAAPADASDGGWGLWPYVAGGAALLVVGLLLVLRRRGRGHDDAFADDDVPAEVAAAPVAAPVADEPVAIPPDAEGPPLTHGEDPATVAQAEAEPVQADAAIEPVAEAVLAEPAPEDVDLLAAAPTPSADRPWLEFALRPVRAGTTVVDAVVEFELTVGNAGAIAADDVRVAAWLLTASPDQDEAITRFLADPPAEAVMDTLSIAAGDGKRIDATIALPKAGLNIVTARDRPFFVPIVVADARYTLPGGGEGRTSAAFVIGTVRPGAEKLGPIWLDRGPRMHDAVEARLHGDARRA